MAITVPPDSTGKPVETFVPATGTDHRQCNVIGDDTTLGARAKVQNADPGSSDYGLTTRDVRGNGTLPVRVDPTGTTAQPISATTLPLPTGAATLAKQPALGTAGSPSVDVISVQGVANGTPQPVSGNVNVAPATSGGTSAYHAVAAASNNAASVKGTAGQVFGWSIYNNAAYPIYVKLYNKATAPAPATDAALLIKVIGVQAGTHVSFYNPCGIAGFAAGIGIAAVRGITDTDNTALALSDCLIEVDYK